MATDIYKLQVEAFLREISGEHRVIDLANPLNTTGNNAPPTRIQVPAIYDCFWRAGLALYRVVKRLTFEEIEKYCPSFIVEQSVTLTSGVGQPSPEYETILDDAIAMKNGTSYEARRYSLTDALRYRNTSGKRKSPSLKHPKFEIKRNDSTSNTEILCYPLSESFSSITIKGYKAPALLALSSSGKDTWNQAFSDLLIAGAIAIHKKTGELNVSQLYMQELNTKYGLFKQPTVNQNNSEVEQTK